jgi:hypothetical protein
MAAMSTKPLSVATTPAGAGAPPEAGAKAEAIEPTVIFEDASLASRPIRDPKSASLIFRPAGQGCFP